MYKNYWKYREWINTLRKMSLKKCIKSKIKHVCCMDEFSGYGINGDPKPLISTQVLAVRQIKIDISDKIE